jgi:hypothetical protein
MLLSIKRIGVTIGRVERNVVIYGYTDLDSERTEKRRS